MRTLLAAALFALASAVAAQSPAPRAPEPKASDEPRLNLNLDDASRRQILRDLPSERSAESASSTLPSLGGGRGNPSISSDMKDKRPFPKSGLDPAPTAPPPR